MTARVRRSGASCTEAVSFVAVGVSGVSAWTCHGINPENRMAKNQSEQSKNRTYFFHLDPPQKEMGCRPLDACLPHIIAPAYEENVKNQEIGKNEAF